ncbi:PaaI family thioesterase [Aquabacterium sp. OR-4]|uniref:PaaI family thioesterase n=1 Tax=Aquabacterium sp. OR-4 TaxID=2978127 RepID=UPI0021B42697|nr:PaaI family thioesterase [Aquabacterium sp. OR-4]MDT7836728.1 PaaI family thioesterase [Aquabacterium sp. OR-4]
MSQDPTPELDAAALQTLLSELFAPWVQELQLRVLHTRRGAVTLALPVTPRHVHAGQVLCGQTLMAAADTAMVLAASSQLGGFRPMTTVQLQTSFLRPIPGSQTATAGEAQVVARVLRAGKSLVFGEIELLDAQGRLAAHATTTCALL